MINDLPEWLSPYLPMAVAVGSRVTCNPPPKDTDRDVLLLIPESHYEFFRFTALSFGFTMDGSPVFDTSTLIAGDDQFKSFSKGDLNLIVTSSMAFYDRFLAASSVAKRLNLLEKSDRIALFQAVLYANGGDHDPFR